jgi:uncharacterized damage-inducible protein DinB
MPITEALLPEFDHEMGSTRRLLDRVPEADFAWKPHEKSRSMGELAGHLAAIPKWCSFIINAASLDLDSIADGARPQAPASRAALLQEFDAKVKSGRASLATLTDAELLASWTLKKGDQVFFTLPKISALRSFVLNHTIHHRGQLSVYLRLRNIPVPPIYGPTADEQ